MKKNLILGIIIILLLSTLYAERTTGYAISDPVLTDTFPISVIFYADKTTGSPGESFQFSDYSTRNITTWQWDFNSDDVIDSNLQNPTHIYSTVGVYTVTLLVHNAFGFDTEIKDQYITISENPTPVTLSSFTAAYANSASTLNWITQSESNNLGWNVYKSQTENAENSLILNTELIPGAGVTTEPTYYSFIDDTDLVDNITYYYWIEDVTLGNISNLHGPVSVTITAEEEDPDSPEFSSKTHIHNYPNPFNPTTQLYFSLEENELAEKIEIYNAKGQKVYNVDYPISPHAWNGRNYLGSEVASGIYIYKLTTNDKSYLKKMVLSK